MDHTDYAENYKVMLLHVIKWLEGADDFDALRPISAREARKLARICRDVVFNQMTPEQAINNELSRHVGPSK